MKPLLLEIPDKHVRESEMRMRAISSLEHLGFIRRDLNRYSYVWGWSWTIAALLILVMCFGCGDIHYLRKAQSAYTIAKRQHDAACVNIKAERGPAWCPEREEELNRYYQQLAADITALLYGPLPKEELAAVKKIPAELAVKP